MNYLLVGYNSLNSGKIFENYFKKSKIYVFRVLLGFQIKNHYFFTNKD